MKLVYICSPYAGDITRNTELARACCAAAVDKGVIPLAPHLLFPQFLDDSDPRQREMGLTMGLELLGKCDELWLCTPHLSSGMKREYDYAIRAGILVIDRSQDWQDITMGGLEQCISTHQT